jgi:hypothetical protein
MLKAWVTGTSILIILYMIKFALTIKGIPSEIFGDLLFIAPGLMGILVAVRAPRLKIFLASTMGLPVFVLFIALNNLAMLLGSTRAFPNYPGDTLVYSVMLANSTVFAFIGGFVGWLISRKKSDNASLVIKSAE